MNLLFFQVILNDFERIWTILNAFKGLEWVWRWIWIELNWLKWLLLMNLVFFLSNWINFKRFWTILNDFERFWTILNEFNGRFSRWQLAVTDGAGRRPPPPTLARARRPNNERTI